MGKIQLLCCHFLSSDALAPRAVPWLRSASTRGTAEPGRHPQGLLAGGIVTVRIVSVRIMSVWITTVRIVTVQIVTVAHRTRPGSALKPQPCSTATWRAETSRVRSGFRPMRERALYKSNNYFRPARP